MRTRALVFAMVFPCVIVASCGGGGGSASPPNGSDGGAPARDGSQPALRRGTAARRRRDGTRRSHFPSPSTARRRRLLPRRLDARRARQDAPHGGRRDGRDHRHPGPVRPAVRLHLRRPLRRQRPLRLVRERLHHRQRRTELRRLVGMRVVGLLAVRHGPAGRLRPRPSRAPRAHGDAAADPDDHLLRDPPGERRRPRAPPEVTQAATNARS